MAAPANRINGAVEGNACTTLDLTDCPEFLALYGLATLVWTVPGGHAHRQGPLARHRRARVSPARHGRGEAALPDLLRRIREAVGGNHDEPGVQQVGVGVRGRPDGRRRDRLHRPPREARPVPRRVLPRPPCPHAGGLAAQKACTLPMLRLLNFRCSFCSSPLDETQYSRRRHGPFRARTGRSLGPTLAYPAETASVNIRKTTARRRPQ